MSFLQFKERLKEYFTFTRKERNGILILLCLMIIMQGAIIYSHFLEPASGNHNFPSFEKEILAFEKNLSAADTFIAVKAMNVASLESDLNPGKIIYHEFDPNKITAEQWKQFGVNDRTIHSINNYLNKGGQFRKKEDLKKIYTLNPEVYQILEPYIVINLEKPKWETEESANKEFPAAKKSLVIIELNNASREELMTLPLIGEKRAEQIIRYRDLLGGFVAKEQLKEVYAIPDSVYQLVKPAIIINNAIVKHININADSISALKHLYIKKPIAQLIVNYRLQHGNYRSVEDLRKLPLMNDSLFKKIEQYLVVE